MRYFLGILRKNFTQNQSIFLNVYFGCNLHKTLLNLNGLWIVLFANFASKFVHIVCMKFAVSLSFSNLNFLSYPTFQAFNMDSLTTSWAFTWWYNVIFCMLSLTHKTNLALGIGDLFLDMDFLIRWKQFSNFNFLHLLWVDSCFVDLFSKFDQILVSDFIAWGVLSFVFYRVED